MGAAQSIPVVGEITTVVEAGGKAVAGGACKLFGADEAGQELLNGAKHSLENYAEVNLLVSNVRVIAAKIGGDDKEADHLLKRQGDAWMEVIENTPVVGHSVGIYHYIEGDTEAGNRCMIGASRTAAVLVATVATGGIAGPVTAGVAAAGAGLATDVVTTGISSAAKGEFTPTGAIAGVKHAIDTGNANDIFDAAVIPAADFAAGYISGKAASKAIAEGQRAIPAAEFARERLATDPQTIQATYEKFSVREGTSPQVPHADIMQHPKTADMVKIFNNPGEAIESLANESRSYDFVRLEDGSVRCIEHADAVAAAKELKSDLRVGHTTLVPPNTEVVAAGEFYFDNKNINNINPQSGHFRVPLEVMTTQMGNQLPVSALTLRSPLLTRLLGHSIASNPVFKATIRHVYVYSPTIFAIHTQDDRETSTPLADSTHILTVKETAEIKVLTFFCPENARAAYDASPSDLSRFLWDRGSGELVASEDKEGVVDQCRASALSINKVFPGGSWRAACRDIESWWDETLGKYEMRCTHAGANGADFTDEIVFQVGDIVEIRDSLLVVEPTSTSLPSMVVSQSQ